MTDYRDEPTPEEVMAQVSPEHYQFDGVQVISITRHLDFCLGNVVKYASRAGRKHGESALIDLEKARQYLEWAIEDRK